MLEEHRLESGMSVWLARPDTDEPRPAVMWLHERYGIVQHPKDMAERLAEVGYVGVSPDLFHRYDGDVEAVARGEARVEIRDDEVIDDFDEVIRFLRSQDYVRSDSIGIIGVCQTGRAADPVCGAPERRGGGCCALRGRGQCELEAHAGAAGAHERTHRGDPVSRTRPVRRGGPHHLHRELAGVAWRVRAGEQELPHPRLPGRAARLVQRYDAGKIPPGADRRRMEPTCSRSSKKPSAPAGTRAA